MSTKKLAKSRKLNSASSATNKLYTKPEILSLIRGIYKNDISHILVSSQELGLSYGQY